MTHVPPHAATVTLALALAVVTTAGCGARTALDVEPCDGGSRACETACGEGTQACVAGRWSACEVAVTERPCAGSCGEGTQTCDPDEGWSACRTPPTRVDCENACGVGTASCVDGVLGACRVPPADRPCTTPCGEGVQLCDDGAWGRCLGPAPLPPILTARVRDFRESHPDFEDENQVDPGIVEDVLGPDGKPVYAGPTPTTHGRERFDEWYRDVPGVNRGLDIELPLVGVGADAGPFRFSDRTFFPIDGALFGNEGRPHNFHFTLEAEAEFVYRGGELFRVEGDDDLFVFVAGRLVVDLGGVHAPMSATVDLDAEADRLGLVVGERYPIKVFFAERHTDGSSLTIETTLADPLRCE